ncbi:MAG: esterase-like activity of phytase family protein [Pararhodobacter sp.]
MPNRFTRRHVLRLSACAALILPCPVRGAVADRPDALVHWPGAGPFFDGFSGLEVTTDRSELITISDRGFGLRARMLRDAQGLLRAVEKIDHFILQDADGDRLDGPRADAEGLDLRPDGGLHVSFEGGRRSRVARFDARGRSRETLPRNDAWSRLHANASLEALALDSAGRAHVIPEDPLDGGFPVFRLEGGRWRVLATLPPLDDFHPVGADFGPDGALYLLERKFRLAFFRNRISRLEPGRWAERQVLVETGYGTMDNHEGISITTDAQGRLWATTISDDNRNLLQRTELAEFQLR